MKKSIYLHGRLIAQIQDLRECIKPSPINKKDDKWPVLDATYSLPIITRPFRAWLPDLAVYKHNYRLARDWETEEQAARHAEATYLAHFVAL